MSYTDAELLNALRAYANNQRGAAADTSNLASATTYHKRFGRTRDSEYTIGMISKQLIGDAYESTVTWEILNSLTSIGNRMAGQQGEKEGALALESKFSELVFSNISISSFAVPGWWREDSSLVVNSDSKTVYDSQHEIIALPGSPSDSVTGEIVDIGPGTLECYESANVEDKIVLVLSENPEESERWVHRTEKYNLAVDNGAIGFLFQNEIPGCLPLTGWIGDDGPGAIPAVGLSRESGSRLTSTSENRPTQATLTVDAHNEPSTSHTLEATLGPETPQEILLTAHVDAHDISEGATDNAVGCALVTEIGRLLHEHADLEMGIRLVIFGSEEIGLRGSKNWIQNNDLSSVKGIVNIDGNELWEDITVYTHGSDTLQQVFSDVSESLHPSMGVTDDYLSHSDHWPFVCHGTPGVMIRSESNMGRGWGHTHGDTIDKLDQRPLQIIVIALTESILRLASEQCALAPLDRAVIRDALVDASEDIGLKATNDWPFGE